jgi:dihydroorotase
LLDGLARLTCGPASILGRTDLGRLSEGAVADVVVVDPDTPKRVEATTMNSLSQNCIFDGVSLSGHVEATLVAGEIVHGTEESS